MGKTNNEPLREAREAKGLKQKDLAKILGISQQHYSLYESGKNELRQEQIRKLCLCLDVSADYLLGLPSGLGLPR